MLRSYLFTAWRTIRREPLFAAINIFGLAVGLACCILMLLLVHHETSYDTAYTDSDRLYQVYMVGEDADKTPYRTMPRSLLISLESDPDVDMVGTYMPVHDQLLFTVSKEPFNEDYIAVDENFFRLLDQPFLSGNPGDALNAPGSVVITESLAANLFGSNPAQGETLLTDKGVVLTVTGVIADFPNNSHIHERLFVNLVTNEQTWGGNHGFNDRVSLGLLRLSRHSGVAAIANRLNAEYQAYPKSGNEQRDGLRFQVRPLPEIHLAETAVQILGIDRADPAWSLSNQRVVVIGVMLAFLVLGTAILNFINMMIARSEQRRREIATRKALGASRIQLIAQHLVESILLTGIASVAAIGLTAFSLPGFSALVDRPLSLGPLVRPAMLATVVVLTGGVGLLAGSFPAWVLSRLSPLPSQSSRNSGLRLRQALVFGQFFVASVLIVVAITAERQLDTFRNQDFGFDQDLYILEPNVRSLNNFIAAAGAGFNSNTWALAASRIQAELVKHPAIASVSVSGFRPGQSPGGSFAMELVDGPDSTPVMIGGGRSIDTQFLDAYGIPLLAGRNSSPQYSSDISKSIIGSAPFDPTIEIIVGQTGGAALLTKNASRLLGFESPELAIGARIKRDSRVWLGTPDHNLDPIYTVIGVVGNVVLGDGMGGATAGYFIFLERAGFTFAIKVEQGQDVAAVDAAKETLGRVAPGLVFDISYVQENLARALQPFTRLMIGFVGIAAMTIVLSCLGLYAVTVFVVSRRSKEIGVRKVLGASKSQLIRLLAWDLNKPVLAASALALPTGYVISSYVLEPFANRIPIDVSILGPAAAVTLLIAAVTVSGQTIRLASTRPSDLIRYE